MIPEITLKKDKTLIQCGASSHTVYSLYLHILAISEELFDNQTAKHSNPVHCVFLWLLHKCRFSFSGLFSDSVKIENALNSVDCPVFNTDSNIADLG